jgi:TRAP-type transport system periplasmic protein
MVGSNGRFGSRLRAGLRLAAAAGVALGLVHTTAQAQDFSFRMAVGDPISSSVGVTAEKYAELVAEKTDGQVQVEVFPDGVLFGGDQNAAVNQLGDGSLDMLILSTNVFASFEPRMNAMSLPYLFSDYDELLSYMAGKPGQTLLASLDRLGIKGLSLMLRTFRDVTANRPITTAADLKGLKLRVPNNQLFVKFFQAVGANPTPMAFTEVYTALQLGAIDGQENPVEVPLANRFYEVQDNLNLTRHIVDGYILAVNQELWNGLPEDIQGAMQEAALEAAAFKAEYDRSEETRVIQELKDKGMTVNELAPGEKQKLQQIAIDLYPQFEDLIGAEFMAESLDFLGRK